MSSNDLTKGHFLFYTLYILLFYRRSLNAGVASVKPIYDSEEQSCSHSATVFVESRLPQRKTTLLIAENESTGVVLQASMLNK